MKTCLPGFPGFYCSILNDAIDSDIAYSEDDGIREVEKVDREAISRAACRLFAHEIGVNMEFESLWSPREYNFMTDRIFAEIPQEEVSRIFSATDRGKLAEAIREQFTSRDGFISFYSASLGDWPKDITQWDHNQVETLLLAYCQTKDLDLGQIWETVIEKLSANGHILNNVKFEGEG